MAHWYLYGVFTIFLVFYEVSSQNLCGSSSSGPCILRLGSSSIRVNNFQSGNVPQRSPVVPQTPVLTPVVVPQINNRPDFQTQGAAPAYPGVSRLNQLRGNYYLNMYQAIQQAAKTQEILSNTPVTQKPATATQAPSGVNTQQIAATAAPTVATQATTRRNSVTTTLQPAPTPTPQPPVPQAAVASDITFAHQAPAPGPGCNVACVTGDQQLEFVCPTGQMPRITQAGTSTSSSLTDSGCPAPGVNSNSVSTCVDSLTPTYIQVACDQKFNKMSTCSLFFQKTQRADIYLLAPECSQRLQWECATISYECIDPNTYTPTYNLN